MKFWDFQRSRAYVRKLRLGTSQNFYAWAVGELAGFPAKPDGIPANPHQVYVDEWAGFPDWLDTENVAPFRREWAPFDYARQFVHLIDLTSGREWDLFASGKLPSLGTRPVWLPSNPNLVYLDEGWAGMRDWLGTGDPRPSDGTRMRSFEEARKFARSLRLNSWKEWLTYVAGDRLDLPDKPADVPACPQATYRKRGWTNYADFLGGTNVAWHQVKWRDFAGARAFARSLELGGMHDWRSWVKSGQKPSDIPANPDKAYSQEWDGWRDWLGRSPSKSSLRHGHMTKKNPRFTPLLHTSSQGLNDRQLSPPN